MQTESLQSPRTQPCALTGNQTVNVSENERQWSKLIGGALVLLGVRQGHLLGLLAVGAGAGFLYRGATGHCYLYESLDIDTTCENC